MKSKLQRIENLDKAIEHLMRRVEALDLHVHDNIDKTDAVIAKLRTLNFLILVKLNFLQPNLHTRRSMIKMTLNSEMVRSAHAHVVPSYAL